MKTRILSGLAVLLVAWGNLRRRQKPAVPPDHARNMQEGLALFKAKVRPVLLQHCLDCHGGKATKGDLDLSDREPLVKSGVLEGGSKESRLAVLIRHEDEPHMPQKAPKLPDATIADISRWIDLGAPYDRPLVDRHGDAKPSADRPTGSTSGRSGRWPSVSPPAVQDAAWVRTPDRSVHRRRARATRTEAQPDRRSPHADPPRLLRPDGLAPVARGGRRVRQ